MYINAYQCILMYTIVCWCILIYLNPITIKCAWLKGGTGSMTRALSRSSGREVFAYLKNTWLQGVGRSGIRWFLTDEYDTELFQIWPMLGLCWSRYDSMPCHWSSLQVPTIFPWTKMSFWKCYQFSIYRYILFIPPSILPTIFPSSKCLSEFFVKCYQFLSFLCRPDTCYSSAHDTDASLTIDKYYDQVKPSDLMIKWLADQVWLLTNTVIRWRQVTDQLISWSSDSAVFLYCTAINQICT